MGLPHQTMSSLVGTSYLGDYLNVGGSNIVNKYKNQTKKQKLVL